MAPAIAVARPGASRGRRSCPSDGSRKRPCCSRAIAARIARSSPRGGSTIGSDCRERERLSREAYSLAQAGQRSRCSFSRWASSPANSPSSISDMATCIREQVKRGRSSVIASRRARPARSRTLGSTRLAVSLSKPLNCRKEAACARQASQPRRCCSMAAARVPSSSPSTYADSSSREAAHFILPEPPMLVSRLRCPTPQGSDRENARERCRSRGASGSLAGRSAGPPVARSGQRELTGVCHPG